MFALKFEDPLKLEKMIKSFADIYSNCSPALLLKADAACLLPIVKTLLSKQVVMMR